jgi:tetratricopeptide (TPR) repeat protein
VLYNNQVTNSFGTRHLLTFLLLMVIIPVPRLLAGLELLDSARASASTSDFDSAVSAYSTAAARLPWYCLVFGETGQAYWSNRQPGEAVYWFSRGKSCQGLTMEQWLAYGDALAFLGEQGSAVRVWKAALIQYGPSSEALSRLAMAARLAGNYAGALDLYQQALELSPDDVDAHYQMALILVATDPASALPRLMQVSNLDPDREADILVFRTELNRAFLVADPAYQFTLAGRVLASFNEWDLAAEAFRRAILINDQFAEAWAWRAEAKQLTGGDGRPDMEKAIALDPLSAGIHGLDGLVWMQMGFPENALLSYEKAAGLEPGNAIWQISMGNAACAAGDLLAALQHYYLAIELAPEDSSTWRVLVLFSLDNEIDVANTGLAAAQELYVLAPDDWETYLLSGRVSMMLDARLEARTLFMKAIDLAPLEPAPHYYLGLSFLESRMYTLAYDKFMDVINLDPTGIYGWQAQRLLEEYFP